MARARSLLVAGVLLATGAAAAASFPQTALFMLGYSEVTADMLHGSAHDRLRRADDRAYLAVSIDLNGDHRIDEVRLLRNDKDKTVSVVATIRSRDQLDTYFLKTVPLAALDRLAIRAERPGDQRGAKDALPPGLVVFGLGTANADIYRFDGQAFVRKPVAPPHVARRHRKH